MCSVSAYNLFVGRTGISCLVAQGCEGVVPPHCMVIESLSILLIVLTVNTAENLVLATLMATHGGYASSPVLSNIDVLTSPDL